MKFWTSFIIFLGILFLSILGFYFFDSNEIPITGNVPLTGILEKQGDQLNFTSTVMNISFEMNENEIYRLWDLNYALLFEVNSIQPVKVKLNYLILDDLGNPIYFGEEELIVSESFIFEGNFDKKATQEINLDSGKYFLVLGVSYLNIDDSFKGDFEIKEASSLGYLLKQLFDIKLELEEDVVYSSKDLVANVVFENFGEGATLVNLTFIIFDENDLEVYRDNLETIVETEQLVKESFLGLDILPGKYVVILRTIYGGGVEDYFEQSFELKKKQDYWFLVIFGFILLGGIYFLFRERFKGKKK